MKLFLSLVVLKVDDADLSAKITDLWERDPDAGTAVVALLRDDPRLDLFSRPTMVFVEGEPASFEVEGPGFEVVADLTARTLEDDRIDLDLHLVVEEDGFRVDHEADLALTSGRSERIEVPGLLVFARSVPVAGDGRDELRASESAWKKIAGDASDARPAVRRRRAEALLADPR